MKKIYLSVFVCAAMLCSCGMMGNMGQQGGTNGNATGNAGGLGNIITDVLGSLANKNTVNSLLDLVIGKTTITQDQLVGTWHYYEPGCAFTSEKLLAQAGGAVAAGKVKEKLQPVYNSVGIKASNTYFTFGADNRFQAKIDGLPLSGTYVLNPESGSVKLNATFISLTAYLTRTTGGISFTFESKKLLQVLQTLSSLSGNTTIKTIGNLSNEYSGVRVGFNLKK